MLLVVGLGNPGPTYLKNKHNIGFAAIDKIAQFNDFPQFSSSKISNSQGALGKIYSQKILLLKPLTFMNKSGISVKASIDFFKINIDNILVIHDDLDLAPGEIRLKKGGGHGGHNGLRSISEHIGADYRRLRIGIGHPQIKALVSDYVLSNFTSKDIWMEPLIESVGILFSHLISDIEGKTGFKDGSKFMEELKIRLQ